MSVPANEGGSCSSGDACRVSSYCSGGVCSGGVEPACSLASDGCCPSGCTHLNDADCSSCPGIELAGNCVYVPTTATVANKAAAQTSCQALGAGWDLCSTSIVCMTDTLDYLQSAGCACGPGGAATCACGSSANLYVHVSGASPYYIRDPVRFPTCISSASCTNSVSESCGTPLCCRPL